MRFATIFACIAFLCVLTGCPKGGGSTGGAGTVATVGKVRDREELRKLLVGKTEAEVIEAIGKPEKTTSSVWYYTGISRDPITGKVDGQIHLNISNGKVTEVYF